mmetsp:Transcript_24388/g.68537  ORF Transcript_24388/g.68537 Transcript_24388/m.68537 type:complete len:291 (+) Transcript_24388:246-1118(+)
MQGLAAMMTSSDGNALHIQERAEIAGMYAIHGERANGRSFHSHRRSECADSLHLAHAFVQVLGQFVLVLFHLVHPNALQVLDRRPQSNSLRDCRSSGLESGRRFGVCCAFHRHMIDHLASALVRWHGIEQILLAPQKADTSRGAHFVSGRGQKVDAQILHIHLHVRYRLACIQHDLGIRALRSHHGNDFLDRVDACQHVGNMREGHQFRILVQQRFHLFDVQSARLFVQLGETEFGTGALRQDLPWHQVGMMLHFGEHDFVTSLDVCDAVRIRHQIQGFGRAAGVHDLIA